MRAATIEHPSGLESGARRSDALVLFGASGDLAFKEIFPALQGLAAAGQLEMPVIGVARSDWTRDQFIALAHSFVARLMVYSARTSAERAAVNWTEVIRRVDLGIKADFAPEVYFPNNAASFFFCKSSMSKMC